MTWLRVRHIRRVLAIWALLGALMHAGWAPHHTLMRAGWVPTALAAAEAAIEAADTAICRAGQTQTSPTHPAGKMSASSCPVCSLYAASAVKGASETAGVAYFATLQAAVFNHTAVPVVSFARFSGVSARGPPQAVAI